MLSSRGGLIFEAHCTYVFENKPPPQSGPCLMLKKGGGGAYFRDDTVIANVRQLGNITDNCLIPGVMCGYIESLTGYLYGPEYTDT